MKIGSSYEKIQLILNLFTKILFNKKIKESKFFF